MHAIYQSCSRGEYLPNRRGFLCTIVFLAHVCECSKFERVCACLGCAYGSCVFVYLCICVSVYVFMCVHVCMCVCVYLCMFARSLSNGEVRSRLSRLPRRRTRPSSPRRRRTSRQHQVHAHCKPVSPPVFSSTDPRPVSLHLTISFACPGRLSSEREEEEEGQGCKGKRRKTCGNQEEGGPYSLRRHGPRPLWLGQVSTRAKDRVVECE